jgi:DNA-binding transcriptional MocR family regulator
MRAAYQERVEALADAVARKAAGALRLRPVHTGLHAVADLEDGDASTVFHEALARGVELMPLSAYVFGRSSARGRAQPGGVDRALVLGFGAVRPDDIGRGMDQLVAAIDAARRRSRPADGIAAR